MNSHDGLCLTRSGSDCNCDAIATCKARTHHQLCPCRYADPTAAHGCECAGLLPVAS